MAGTLQSCSVLVLGANGKLGRMVCRLWKPMDLRVLPIFRPGRGREDSLTWEPGQVAPEIEAAEAVVALWGVTPGANRDLKNNTRLAEAATSLASELKAKAVIHCSSAAVYRPALSSIDESTVPDPQSAYGMAKLEMEQAIADLSGPEGPRQIILRIGNVAGADSLFANLRSGGQVQLDDFGQWEGPARSYLAPRDLVRVIEALTREPSARGIYNVAAPRPTRMADLARAAGANVTWRQAPHAAFPMMWLDTTRLSDLVPLSADSADADYLVRSAAETGVWA